ncbi:unnamed protein product [marine sediment metagenome]|uniref:Ribbon-helix-helix protein CopG domain-containing protein n=1 Tax=marine sediment metagenome TaxID=412755 RepID=X1BJQ2_9ZZZZ
MAEDSKSDKTRVSITLTEAYVEALGDLVKEGIYLNRGEVVNDALRRLFISYNMEQFVSPLNKET